MDCNGAIRLVIMIAYCIWALRGNGVPDSLRYGLLSFVLADRLLH